ncbi:MAG: ferredoxin family protein [Deltaproteobacteria bacterium]|nr:ferredoxin family protein [Deltaproteobacteria bacterium]
MAYVITRLCRQCLDTSCVVVCPVSCIYEYAGADGGGAAEQLYIHPEDCIDCGACEPECPWQAIFEEALVPAGFAEDIRLNRDIVASLSAFRVAEQRPARRPTAEEVEGNRRKWTAAEGAQSSTRRGADGRP